MPDKIGIFFAGLNRVMARNRIFKTAFFLALFSGLLLGSKPARAEGGYCEGHAKVVIRVPDMIARRVIQNELDHYNAPENEFNGRYELCFDFRFFENLELWADQSLTINNTSNREVVIGFLNAERVDDSDTPVLKIRGHNVTLFNPDLRNAKKAVAMEGEGHKIVGGSIVGRGNVQDSLCVSGNGNNFAIDGLTMRDCLNGIHLTGNSHQIRNTTLTFTELSHPVAYRRRDESGEEFMDRLEATWNGHRTGVCLFVAGENAVLENIAVNDCDGTSLKLLGSGHRLTGSRIRGEPVTEELWGRVSRHSTECLWLRKASNVTVEGNEFSECQNGIFIHESDHIFAGPTQLADFEAKGNKIHHNDYGVHAQFSRQVFVRNNSIYDNEIHGSNADDYFERVRYFGLWLDSIDLPEAQLVRHNIFPSTDDYSDESAISQEHFADEEPFVELRVPAANGRVEFAYPKLAMCQGDRSLYQPFTPFVDCRFENLTLDAEGYGTVTCPLKKRRRDILFNASLLVIVVHADDKGTLPITWTLAELCHGPSGIPVSIPAPESGSMTAGDSSASGPAGAGSVPAGTPGGGETGGISIDSGVTGGISIASDPATSAAARGASCQLNPASQKNGTEFFASVIIMLSVLCLGRKHYATREKHPL